MSKAAALRRRMRRENGRVQDAFVASYRQAREELTRELATEKPDVLLFDKPTQPYVRVALYPIREPLLFGPCIPIPDLEIVTFRAVMKARNFPGGRRVAWWDWEFVG